MGFIASTVIMAWFPSALVAGGTVLDGGDDSSPASAIVLNEPAPCVNPMLPTRCRENIGVELLPVINGTGAMIETGFLRGGGVGGNNRFDPSVG